MKGINTWVLLTIIFAIVVILYAEVRDSENEADSNAVTYIGTSVSQSHRRTKRASYKPSTMDSRQRQIMLDDHNRYRRMENAANMELLVWNDYLAGMAQGWAENCEWKHGQPTQPPGEPPFTALGQNLYTRKPVINPTDDNFHRGLQGFYEEKQWYTFSTRTCQSGKICGHYTQMVWATSREIGCAYHVCPTMVVKGVTWENAFYLVCNYGPAGNYVGQAPYLLGSPCQYCYSGFMWCNDGLCDRSCTKVSSTCQCKANCKNCGQAKSDCSCECPDGWWGIDCSMRCWNTHQYCYNGWYKAQCTGEFYSSQVQRGCPLMCGICKSSQNPVKCDGTTKAISTTRPTPAPTPKPTPSPTAKPTLTTSKPTTRTTVVVTKRIVTEGPRPITSTRRPPLCDKWSCSNGGDKVVSGQRCRCRCNGDWQGPRCTESRQEARIGVIVGMIARKGLWDRIWTALKRIIPIYINQFCARMPDRCCRTRSGLRKLSADEYPFMGEDGVILGKGYPKITEVDSQKEKIKALIYANQLPNNKLCTLARSRREKRATEDETALPQDVLLDAVEESMSNISSDLISCCQTEVEVVERGQEEASSTEAPMAPRHGLPIPVWAVIAIVAGGLCSLSILILVSWFCCCRRSPSKKQSSSTDEGKRFTSSDNNYYQNRGYSG